MKGRKFLALLCAFMMLVMNFSSCIPVLASEAGETAVAASAEPEATEKVEGTPSANTEDTEPPKKAEEAEKPTANEADTTPSGQVSEGAPSKASEAPSGGDAGKDEATKSDEGTPNTPENTGNSTEPAKTDDGLEKQKETEAGNDTENQTSVDNGDSSTTSDEPAAPAKDDSGNGAGNQDVTEGDAKPDANPGEDEPTAPAQEDTPAQTANGNEGSNPAPDQGEGAPAAPEQGDTGDTVEGEPTAAPAGEEPVEGEPAEEEEAEEEEVFSLDGLTSDAASVFVNETIHFKYNATGAERVEFAVKANDGTVVASGEAADGAFEWTPGEPGDYLVSVTAFKGEDTLLASMTVNARADYSNVTVTYTARYDIDGVLTAIPDYIDKPLDQGTYDLKASAPVTIKGYKYIETRKVESDGSETRLDKLAYSAEDRAWLCTIGDATAPLTANAQLVVEYKVINDERFYEYKDDPRINVKVTLARGNAVPDAARLVVTPITNGRSYDAYMEALNTHTEEEYTGVNTLLYDFAFIMDELDPDTGEPNGKTYEVQPAPNTMKVEVTFKDNQITNVGAEDKADVGVVHMPLKDGVLDDGGITAKAVVNKDDIQVDTGVDVKKVDLAGANEDKVTFNTDSFSVFAFTVDFTLNEETYSFPGAGTYTLREVMDALGIADALLDDPAPSLEFVSGDETDVERKLSLVQENGEWVIKNEIAFTDTFRLTFYAGLTKYVVMVTDAQSFTVEINFYDANGTTPVSVNMNGYSYLAAVNYSTSTVNSVEFVISDSKATATVEGDAIRLANSLISNASPNEVGFYNLPELPNNAGESKELGSFVITKQQDGTYKAVKQPSRTVSVNFYDVDGIVNNYEPQTNPDVPENLYVIVQDNSSSFLYYGRVTGNGTVTLYNSSNEEVNELPRLDKVLLVKYTGTSGNPQFADVCNYSNYSEYNTSSKSDVGTYTLKSVPNTSDTTTTEYVFKLEKKNVYTINLQFVDDENTMNPVVPGSVVGGKQTKPITEYSYALVEMMKDGADPVYSVLPISTSDSVNTIQVDSMNGMDYPAAKAAGWYVNSVKIGHTTDQNYKPQNKEQFEDTSKISIGDYDGYTFVSNRRDNYVDQENKGNPKTAKSSTITLKVADPTVYQVKIDCGDEPLEFPEGYDVYVRVKITYSNTSGIGYAKVTPVPGGATSYLVEPDSFSWYLYQNGTPVLVADPEIQGQEQRMVAELLAYPAGTTVTTDGMNNATAIPLNGPVQTHKVVGYPDIPKGYTSEGDSDPNRVFDKTQNPNVITDIIHLEKNTDTIDVYSLDTLLNHYNIVAVCPDNDPGKEKTGYGAGDYLDGNHTIGGILVRGDLLSVNYNIGSGVAATMPSVVGGYVQDSAIQIIGQGIEREGRNLDFYIGSDNSVLGGYINGAERSYNHYGNTVINDNVVDWERLRNYIVSQSRMMKSVAKTKQIETLSEAMVYGDSTFLERGSKVIKVAPGERIKIDGSVDGVTVIIQGTEGITWSEAAGTVITLLGNNTVYVPTVYLQSGNKKPITPKDANAAEDGDYENAKGLSLVYNAPDASTVVVDGGTSGHVIAPNAEIQIGLRKNGEFNGTMIGNQVHTGGDSEAHMWPYKGGDLISADVTFNGAKTVEGQPADEQFAFVMQQFDEKDPASGDGWEDEPSTAFNKTEEGENKGLIQFISLNFEEVGTFYYRVFEDGGQNKPAYDLDGTRYLVKIVVKADDANGNTLLTPTITYYELTGDEEGLVTYDSDAGKWVFHAELLPADDGETSSSVATRIGVSTTGHASVSRGLIKFNNTEKKVGLTVKKIVESPIGADKTQSYSITITLTGMRGEPVTGTFDGVEFDEQGKATIELKDGQSKEITGLTYGTSYKVVEDTTDLDDFVVSYTREEGTIENDPVTAVVTNARKVGKISVTKTVDGVPEGSIPADATFTFTITNVDDASISKTLEVKAGETKTAENLPLGTYTVSETTQATIPDYVFDSVEIAPISVTLNSNDQLVAVSATNHYKEGPKETSLTVEKEWLDADGKAATWPDGIEKVTVQLQQSTDGGETYNDVTGKSYDLNAEKSSYTFENLPTKTTDETPADITYRVKELDVSGYSTTYATADGTTTITNKKVRESTFEKKIKDTNDSTGETSDWQDSADYDIGDDVPYKLTATLANNVSDYYKYHITFEDVMETGLTFKEITSVKVGDQTLETNEYTLAVATDKHSFTLRIDWGKEKPESGYAESDKLNTGLDGAEVEVLFTATLNEKAVLGSEGNVNQAKLSYSDTWKLKQDGTANEHEKDTEWDYTIAFTYQVEVNKLKKLEGDATAALSGAEFKLEKVGADGKSLSPAQTYTATVAGNTFTFKGLDDGDYILTETKVPNGYKRIEPITFTVTATHEATWDAHNTNGVIPTGESPNARETILTGLNGTDEDGVITMTADDDKTKLTANVVNEEAEKPTFEKKIKDINDSTDEAYSNWQDSADHDIGDDVPYRLTATLADNVSDYYKYHITFEDEMETGLTFKAITSVKVGDTVIPAKSADHPEGYELTRSGDRKFSLKLTWEGEKDGDEYTKTIGETDLAKTLDGETVEVLFTATLNENAVLGSQGNVNKAKLKYSNNCNLDENGHAEDDKEGNEGETEWDYTIVFTYKVVINKKDKDTDEALAGAEFKLEKILENGSTVEIAVAKSNEGKTFTFKGLDDGNYILTETSVPKNYKGLEAPILFTVAAEHGQDNADNTAIRDSRITILTDLTGNVTSGDITLTPSVSEGSLTGSVTNEKFVGDLKISKAVIGTEDDTQVFNFMVTLTPPAGATLDETYPARYSNADADTTVTVAATGEGADKVYTVTGIQLTKGQNLVIKDLPVGTKCVVEEVEVPTYYTNQSGSPEVTISKGVEREAAFTNAYEATGKVSFKAKKVFTNGNLSEHPFTIKLTQVEGEGSTAAVASFTPVTKTVNADGSEQTVVFTDIMTFTKNKDKDDTKNTYWFLLEEVVPDTLTDSNRVDENIKYDTAANTQKWIKVTLTDDNAGKLTVTKTLAADATTDLDVTFTNEQLGGVKVTKTFTGIKELPDSFEISYTVGDVASTDKLTTANATKGDGTASNPYEWVIEGLTIGTKVVFTESGYTNDKVSATFDITTQFNGTDGTSGEVTAAKTDNGAYPTAAVGAFTNTYVRKKGDLEVTKTVQDATNSTTPFTIKVTLTAPEGETLAESYQGSVAGTEKTINVASLAREGVELKNGEKLVVNGLPVGTTYTITETDIPAGFAPQKNNITGTVATGTNSKEIVNKYYAEPTSVTFSGHKGIAGTDQTDKVFTFELYTVGSDFAIPEGATPDQKKTVGEISCDVGQDYSFDLIEYTYDAYLDEDSHVHYYVIKEEALNADGWTIDTQVYNVTVTITDEGAQLKSAVKVQPVDGTEKEYLAKDTQNITGFDFVNEYEAKGSLSFKAEKEVKNGTVADGTYTVKLKQVANANGDALAASDTVILNGEKTATVNDGVASFSFDNVFLKNKTRDDTATTFYFKLEEQIPTDAVNNIKDHIKYDTSATIIKVTLEDNGDGALKVNKVNAADNTNINAGAADAKFVNEQLGSVKVTKVFTGADITIPSNFKITAAYTVDGAEKTKEFTTAGNTGSGTAASPYTWTIEDLPVGTDVTFTEEGITVNGYGVTTTVNGTAVASGSEKGTVQAAAGTDIPTVAFVNTYERDKGSLRIKKSVTLNGVNTNTKMVDGEYSFTVKGAGELNKNIEKTVKITIENGGTKSATVDNVAATMDGDYVVISGLDIGKYTVTENLTAAQKEKGIALVETNGQRVEVVTGTTDIATAEFTNNRNIGSLEIKKTIELADATLTPNPDAQFTFNVKLTAPDGVTLESSYPATNSGDANVTSVTVTDGQINGLKLKGDNTLTIDKLPAGTTYEVEEVQDDMPGGFTLETPASGKQDDTVPTDDTAKAEFVNTYTVTEITAQVSATKEFTGRDWTDKDSFEFTLAADASNPANGATLPTKVVDNATKDNKTVEFGAITFAKPGTYKFTITETVPDGATGTKKDGITYDNTPKTITIVVEDNGEGALVIKSKTPEDLTVTAKNVYDVNSTNAQVSVTKQFTGRDWTDEDSFEFTLAADASNPVDGATLPEIKVDYAKKGSETVTFGAINFTKKGTYKFTITETVPTDAENGKYKGIQYDGTPKEITIEVKDDGKGGLYVDTAAEALAVTASNTYSTTPVTAKVSVTKTLTGRAWTTSDSFEFTLDAKTNPEDGATLPEKKTVTVRKNTENQTATFDEITFTKPGTYVFTITETKGNLGGVTYVTAAKEITIEVKDNGEGALVIKSKTPEDLTVTAKNEYKANGTATLKATKAADATLGTKTFTFELYDGETMIDRQDVTQGQTATFKTLEYSLADMNGQTTKVFTYTIKEKIPADAVEYFKDGVTYDNDVHNVKVTVTDDGKGTLNTVVKYSDGDDLPVFTNRYTAEGNVKLTAMKEMVGRPLEDGEFSFVLKDADGKTIQNATNDKDGNIEFDEIHYTLADVANSPFTYTISEVKGNDTKVVYDTHTETIKVTLKDNGDGTITATPDKNGATVKFENKLTSVKISKVDVNGGEELEGAHIQILDEDGEVVTEWDSTDEAHVVTGLEIGKTYTLKETVAPDGYTITTDTQFSIKEDGTVDRISGNMEDDVILVEDTQTSVKVSKVDVDGGEELEGAKIQILDKDGKVVEEWTSGKEAHEVKGLKTGEEYTLHEEVAPDGYTVATDTTFKIDEKGNVTTTGKKTDGGVLLIEDAQTSVKISKVDIADGKELEGAKIQILDKDGKVVEEWTSGKEAHEVKGLKTGEQYTLRETVAPDGYDLTVDTKFQLKDDGTIDNTKTTTTVKDGVLLVEDSKTVVVTATPTTTAKVTPAPTATPAAGPTSVKGKKIWVDDGNYYKTRPESITVQLYANGTLVEDATPTWKKIRKNTWTYTFADLPSVNKNGATINYTVKELPVENYETTINGTTITNTLIPKESGEFTVLSGVKTWDDNDNASGKRPTSIKVHLLRNGVEVASCTVTAADNWQYSFENQPVDTGYGNDYQYEVREDAVPGYFSISDGLNLTNKLFDKSRPFRDENPVESRKTKTRRPNFKGMTEEEFDDLLDMFDYATPLWGMLGTGDETPVYPFVFGGVGVIALIGLLISRRKRKAC